VDVMLVLLIIFMVTAPMMMQGVEVNLPKTTTKNIKTPEEPLILTINKDKEIFLEKHAIELDGLESKISKIFENRKEKEILLRADKDVPYGFVIKVVAKVKGAGIDKLGMVTEPLD
jgi:biopolymer transport protein TolR